jgi:cytochrome c biogenesis protein CcdA
MNASRPQRWDLVVGALASLVSIAGLVLSITLGNTDSLGFGNFHRDAQQFMAVLAAMVLILVAIKAGLRYRTVRKSAQTACAWRFGRLRKRPRRRC